MAHFPTPSFGESRTPASWGNPFLDLHREMNRLFDDAFRGLGSPGQSDTLMAPRIDVHERNTSIEVSAELPGVSQDDVDISIDDDVLTIRGEKRTERKDEKAHVSERFYGAFQRSIQLPFSPDPNMVDAQFENGVLKIILPKQGRQKHSHHIQIRNGSNGEHSERAAIESSSAQPQAAGPGQPGGSGRA